MEQLGPFITKKKKIKKISFEIIRFEELRKKFLKRTWSAQTNTLSSNERAPLNAVSQWFTDSHGRILNGVGQVRVLAF